MSKEKYGGRQSTWVRLKKNNWAFRLTLTRPRPRAKVSKPVAGGTKGSDKTLSSSFNPTNSKISCRANVCRSRSFVGSFPHRGLDERSELPLCTAFFKVGRNNIQLPRDPNDMEGRGRAGKEAAKKAQEVSCGLSQGPQKRALVLLLYHRKLILRGCLSLVKRAGLKIL